VPRDSDHSRGSLRFSTPDGLTQPMMKSGQSLCAAIDVTRAPAECAAIDPRTRAVVASPYCEMIICDVLDMVSVRLGMNGIPNGNV
jgi:hypothetical protein